MVIQGTKDYVALYRDEQGVIVHSENANGEFRQMQEQISKLTQALQLATEQIMDIEELLDHARTIAYEANKKAEGRV